MYSSTDSLRSENVNDIVTEVKPTPHTVPEFLTGRPKQSRENPLSQDFLNNEPLNETSPPVQETANNANSSDPIKHLANVLVGMNNKSSSHTLNVRPVSTTTLTFDGK